MRVLPLPLAPITALTRKPANSSWDRLCSRCTKCPVTCRHADSRLASVSTLSANSPANTRPKPRVVSRWATVAATGALPALSCQRRSPRACCRVSRRLASSRLSWASWISFSEPRDAGAAAALLKSGSPSVAQISITSPVRRLESTRASGPRCCRTWSRAARLSRPVNRCTFMPCISSMATENRRFFHLYPVLCRYRANHGLAPTVVTTRILLSAGTSS